MATPQPIRSRYLHAGAPMRCMNPECREPFKIIDGHTDDSFADTSLFTASTC